MRRLPTLLSSLLSRLMALFFMPPAGAFPRAHFQSTAILLKRLAEVRITTALGKALLFVLFAVLSLVSPSFASGAEPQKRVLIISSVDANLPAIGSMNQAIRATLKKALPARVQIYNEVQDEFQIPNEKYAAEMVSLLRRKYEGERIDVIITLSTPALKFLLKYQRELFSDTPIVFLAEDQDEVASLNLGPNITGVWGQTDLAPTLDIMLALQPETERVVVVAGNSPYDKFWLTKAQNDLRAYESKVKVTYLTDMTIQQLRQELASQPKKSVVLFMSVMVDGAGNSFSLPEALSFLAPTSNAPLYGVSETEMGNGVVGGSVIDYQVLGSRAAELALRVLAGEKPQDIPPQNVPSVSMFDWRQLRRWGIDEAKLPPGSIVRYKEFSVWELYKWRIIGGIALCILEALLILYLLFTRARRRRAEHESVRYARLAEAEHRKLDEVVSNTPGVVWESRLVPGTTTRKIEFVNDYVEQMLGYSVEECLATPNFWFSIVHKADREESARGVEAIFESGQEGVQQFRCVTKDGRTLWAEAHLVAISDETGKAVGLRGVAMDITDRKRAEEALRESEHRFQLVSQATKDILYEWNLQTDFVWWNDSAMRSIFGYPLEEMRHDVNWWEERLHPEDKDRIDVSVSEALGGVEQKWENEYRFRKMDNSYAYVYHRAFIVRDEGGQALRVIGSLMDFTERKQSEEKLRRALGEVSTLKNQLEEENIYLREEIKLAHHFDQIVGRSDATKYVLFKIEQVAPTDTRVLITGETGTGKELVAHAIHTASSRRDRPLVKVNCAALSPTLIESELFGHEKGAFTGATARKIGRFELANGATIFLDEIGELPLELQAKLLRVIQENEFERLGSSKTIQVDARIIAATNRNLKIAVEQGSFREDLWYRLNVFPITVPPLRDRQEDIPSLVEHFVKRFAQKVGRRISSISPATMRTLQDYAWPGNVRELANVVERAVINTNGSVLRVVDNFEKAPVAEVSQTNKTLEEMEREYIVRILDNTGWRIEGHRGAAKVLGLNPSTLRTRISKLGIQKSDKTLTSSLG